MRAARRQPGRLDPVEQFCTNLAPAGGNPDGSATTFTGLYMGWLTAAEQLLDEGRTELRPIDIRTPMIEACFCL